MPVNMNTVQAQDLQRPTIHIYFEANIAELPVPSVYLLLLSRQRAHVSIHTQHVPLSRIHTTSTFHVSTAMQQSLLYCRAKFVDS